MARGMESCLESILRPGAWITDKMLFNSLWPGRF